jgi:hypothetical protein
MIFLGTGRGMIQMSSKKTSSKTRFISAIAGTVDLFSRNRPASASYIKASRCVKIHYNDRDALSSDWEKVGQDIRLAVVEYGRKLKKA